MVRILIYIYHACTYLSLGQCCDEKGDPLPEGAPPPPINSEQADGDYFPYDSRAEFELADFLFRKDQMSGNNINELMDIWATHQQELYDDDGATPPFANAQDLYNIIDGTEHGDVPWQAFSVKYNGDVPHDSPKWMSASYNGEPDR